jgi:cell division protein FtsW
VRWVVLGPFRLQVSEPARLLIFIYLAGYIVRRSDELSSGIKGFLKPMALIGFAGLFLLVEPDFGATLVLTCTALAMLFLGGARLKDFALCAGIAALAALGLVLASPYRLARLTGFLHPWADPFDTGFQLTNSLIAIGQGQWFGVGLGESVQKLFYLPEAHTDFVFAVTAEEFGLLGSALVIGLYLALTWRALLLARRAAKREQLFGAYLAFGIGIWIGLQAFINMGVNMGVLPTKGLTLPLMSYGGSSLIVSCAAIGLLMRVDRETRESGKWKSDADEVTA